MKKVDMDGQKQQSFLDAPTIDVSHLPSRKALEFRLAQTVDIIQKGDYDFARYRGWKGLDVKEKDKHLKDQVMIDGELWTWAMVKGVQTFMSTWEARKAYLLDDCRDLQRSIGLATDENPPISNRGVK